MIKQIKEWWKNKFWMTCDNCGKKMRNYYVQALVQTKDGCHDRFYCQECGVQ